MIQHHFTSLRNFLNRVKIGKTFDFSLKDVCVRSGQVINTLCVERNNWMNVRTERKREPAGVSLPTSL